MIILSSIVRRSPLFYGIAYLALIPIYATLYFFFPNIIGSERSYVECLYFSTVTITTLGYGDITPLGEVGKLVSASEALFGVVSSGLFLNAIASDRNDTVREEQAAKDANDYRELQRSRLNGHYSLIHPLARRFRQSVIQVTCPLEKQPREYDPDFKLGDMRDMYQSTLLMREPYLRPAIRGYFEVLEDLHRELSDLIKGVDLRCFPEIEAQSLNLVGAITEFDYSGAILSAVDMKMGEGSMADFVVEMLKSYEGSHEIQGSNVLDGYILLCHQIKIGMESLTRLEMAVEGELRSPEGK